MVGAVTATTAVTMPKSCVTCGRPAEYLSTRGRCLSCIREATAAAEAQRVVALIPADPGPVETTRSWREVDLSPVLDGTWSAPQPTVGRRGDGCGLFYPAKCHTVVSETEGGKTWLALSACRDEMDADHHVVYVDFEDDEGGIVGRLLTLGAHRDALRERFHYVRPDGPIGTGIHLDDLRGLLAEHAPTLAILDGITEAMVMHGLNPLDNADAATFSKLLPRRLATAGAAVVSLDHVVKASEARGRYALGAVHKLNGLDGAQYVLENRAPFGIGLVGKSAIRIAKDRPGQLRRHALGAGQGLHWFGDLVLDSLAEGFAEVSIEPPHEHEANWRPTMLMQRVAEALAGHEMPSKRVVRTTVQGKAEAVTAALDFLILDGYVNAKPPYRLLRPYPS